MRKNYTSTARRLILANNSACNVVFRRAAGSEADIERTLNDADTMTVILRHVTRMKMCDIERLIENIATPGVDDTRATWGDVQTVLMQNYVQNRKSQ